MSSAQWFRSGSEQPFRAHNGFAVPSEQPFRAHNGFEVAQVAPVSAFQVASEQPFRILCNYAEKRTHVFIVPSEHRVRVNWGAYSMVQATLNILRYSFGILHNSSIREPLEFHKFLHLAASR